MGVQLWASVIAAIAALLASAIGAFVLLGYRTRIPEAIRNEFQRSLELFKSRRSWEESAVADLLGPMYAQFDRTASAFNRWKAQNLYIEAKVIREGNTAIRDLLLQKAHLVPPELRDSAKLLVDHYDHWLEEYERVRETKQPGLHDPVDFVFTYDFPHDAETRFRETYKQIWTALYGGTA